MSDPRMHREPGEGRWLGLILLALLIIVSCFALSLLWRAVAL